MNDAKTAQKSPKTKHRAWNAQDAETLRKSTIPRTAQNSPDLLSACRAPETRSKRKNALRHTENVKSAARRKKTPKCVKMRRLRIPTLKKLFSPSTLSLNTPKKYSPKCSKCSKILPNAPQPHTPQILSHYSSKYLPLPPKYSGRPPENSQIFKFPSSQIFTFSKLVQN